MKFKELGKTGERIPCIGMGGWKLSSESAGAIREGISLGMRFIDVAEMYGTEGIVGEAVRGQGDVFIASKVSPHHFRYEDVIRACGASLARLGIKAIDLYQLHWPNAQVPIKDTMRAMERLVKDGKIRHIGVCNFSVQELEGARTALKSEEIVSEQAEYSVFVRDPERGMLDYCIRNGMTTIAYSPFANGSMFDADRSAALARLNAIGSKYGKTGAQVALNWLVSKKPVVTIPKASSIEHVRENAGAADFRLSKADDAEIGRLGSFRIKPMASRLNRFTRRTTSLWSGLMQKREETRAKYGI